jgi:hypothetical protein
MNHNDKMIGLIEGFIKEYQQMIADEQDPEVRSRYQNQLQLLMNDHDKLMGQQFLKQVREWDN